jgi:hypothetical protein
MPERKPEDVLKDIVESDADEEIERALAMTPEQRRAELEAAGVDVNELHAKADAFRERLHGAAKPEAKAEAKTAEPPSTRVRSLPPRAPSRSLVNLVAAAGASFVLGGAAHALLTNGPPVVSRPPPDRSAAVEMRKRAFAACDAMKWAECVARLDDAKLADPDGDSAADVQGARQQAARALGTTPHGP